MKRLTTIAAMIISFTAFGQDSLKSKVSSEFKRILFGVNISPDYCYRTLKNNDGSSTSSMIIDFRNKNEEFKFGYTAGLNVCYNISKRLGIELDMQYTNKGYTFKNSDLVFGDVIDPRYGFVYVTSGTVAPTNIKFIYNNIYLDIPIRAVFSFGEKRIHLVTSIGVTTNVLLKTTQTSVLEYKNGDTKRETHDELYDFKSLGISPTISVGADYKVNNRINLRAEPTFRYGLLKISDTPITAYLWSAGLNISCYYAIK